MTLARLFDEADAEAQQGDGSSNSGGGAAAAAAESSNAAAAVVAAAPTTSLARALVIFLLVEELPTLALTLCLQSVFNYAALSTYPRDFGLERTAASGSGSGSSSAFAVVAVEYDARAVECLKELLAQEASAFISTLSSFAPFM
jgi:hypothetical protein